LTLFPPPYEWMIINQIRDKDVLQAVYESIPADLADDKKAQIKNLLKDTHVYNDNGKKRLYGVRLEEDVINSIVI
jgi:hypothetical protein